MRPLAFILLILVASRGVLHAQVQESTMSQRLLQPDRTLGSAMQSKTFSSSGGGVDASKEASVKDFSLFKEVALKSFDTRQFDAKDFWKGDFLFTTKAAPVKADPASGKTFGTKTLPVKEAREAGKGYDSRAYATRDAVVKGKTSQERLDDKFKGQGPMNIDQIRDLLNKPKLE